MAKATCSLYDLARRLPGAYIYRRRGLTSELFPDTFLRDAGGATGWIPFDRGTLTTGGGAVVWDGRTVGGSGVDVVFDLREDCWLDAVAVGPLRDPACACGLGGLSVWVRASGETRFHCCVPLTPVENIPAWLDAWLTLPDLNCRARYVRLHCAPGGNPTYHAQGIGLAGVKLLGMTLAERTAVEQTPRLYPWPAEVIDGNGAVTLDETSGIVSAQADAATARFLAEHIEARWGLRLPVNAAGRAGIALRRRAGLPAEAYSLRCDRRGLVIEGDERGLFYGAQTLLQMLRREDDHVTAPAVRVHDAPVARVRGLHIYMPGRDNLGYCKRLLDVMAELKMNTAIIEVGGGMRLRRYPEINAAWERFAAGMRQHLARGEAALQGDPLAPRRWQNSMHIELGGGSFLEQDEVRDLVDHARRRHITVLPEVQTLSHCYWLLLAHPELAERTDTPYPDTYCPSNAAVYPIVFDVMDEVLDVFQPPAMVIGHDEAWSVGTCPACRDTSAARLIADDVARLHGHLAQRGVRTWMWGDTLHPSYQSWRWERKDIGCYFRAPDTTGLIDLLPKDVVVLNWWWGEAWAPQAGLLGQEQNLAAAGLRQVFANLEGMSCTDFAARAARCGVDGGILPSWVANAEIELGRNGVIANLVASANLLWSSVYRERRDETWQEVARLLPAVRARLSGRPSPRARCGAVFAPISLSDHLNAPPADPVGTLGAYDLRALPAGDVTLAGVSFRIADPADHHGIAAVVVQARDADGAVFPPAVSGIAVNRRVRSLVFLHVASSSADAVDDWQRCDSPQFMARPPAARQTVGRYRMHYADGTQAEVDLRYDEHLTRWNTRYGERITMPYQADPAWQGKAANGEPVTVWLYEWTNERDVPVVCIDVMAADGTDSALILLAITAVER